MDVMLDLETWGTTPGSDIRSIGAVVFDPVAGTLGDEFYVAVDNPLKLGIEGWSFVRKYPLTRDPETVAWWVQQSEAAQRAFDNPVDLADGLTDFMLWLSDCAAGQAIELRLWAHGPQFDEVILAACYRAVVRNIPWHYRAPRDTRTIYDAAGGVDLLFDGTPHNALHDAKHQARCVIEAYRKLGLGRQQPDSVGLTTVDDDTGRVSHWVSKATHDHVKALLREALEGLHDAKSEFGSADMSAAYRDTSALAYRIEGYLA